MTALTVRQDTAVTLPWLREGTARLISAVAALSDEALREPSGLPNWSRAHVVAHVARNAEALGRLAHWAATGDETPMYPDLDARDADIERTAANPAATLRADLATTAADLEQQFGTLDDAAWAATVRSVLGRELPGRELPWMRIREVWLHSLDLDAGVRIADFPPALVDALVDDVGAVVGDRPDCPPVTLRPTDRDRAWDLGRGGERIEVTGTAADLLAWVSGRGSAGLAPTPLPTLPPWI